MELIAKANRQLRKSVIRASSTEEYQTAKFDSSSVNADLICAIHHGPLRDPRRLPCSHSFCYQCLSELRRRNSGNGHRITCPLCRTSHDVDNIDDLYVDYSLMRQLTGANESTEDEDENEKLALEVSRTLRMLKEAETSCDSAMVQIRQMNADVTAMKASIIDKRKALESKLAAARALEDDAEDQKRVLTCLGYDCHFMQEMIKKTQTSAFHPVREANIGVHHTTTLVKGAGLFNIWLKDEHPLTDDQLKKATRLVSQIWLSQENPYQMATDAESARRARGEFAKRLAASFRSHFSQDSTNTSSASSASSFDDDGGVWTAIVGARKLLDFYVYSHREFYICMEIQKMRLVIYRCVEDPDCRAVDAGRAALFETFVRQRLDDALKRRKKDPQNAIRPAQYVSEHLKQGLNGGLWHCVGGPSKTYAIHTTGERASQTVVTVDGYEYGVWQCNCASMRNITRRRSVEAPASVQKGQASRYSEEVEYDEPYCLD